MTSHPAPASFAAAAPAPTFPVLTAAERAQVAAYDAQADDFDPKGNRKFRGLFAPRVELPAACYRPVPMVRGEAAAIASVQAAKARRVAALGGL